jgi:hypothetical protein
MSIFALQGRNVYNPQRELGVAVPSTFSSPNGALQRQKSNAPLGLKVKGEAITPG